MNYVLSKKNKDAAATNNNFDYLVDLELLLLAWFQFILTIVHRVIKFAQACVVFVCDFLQSVKCVQEELARKSIDPTTAFRKDDLKEYHQFLEPHIMHLENILDPENNYNTLLDSTLYAAHYTLRIMQTCNDEEQSL